ncbi:hypothetical protein ACQKEY_24625 [Lysinibacillus fusiformis]|uniref:hypothetical protein n=1 Tax=Lysinibacillus fusiformis TaxID=28031 RepID=UPI003D0876F3
MTESMKLKQNSVYGKLGMEIVQEKDDIAYYDTDSIISMTDEQKQLWEQINNDIEDLYMNYPIVNNEPLLQLVDRLMINRNTLNGLINDNGQPFIKVKLTNLGVEIYKQFNGFWESNFDEDGYSTFSKEYFERVFEGLNINDITKHDLIHFNK